MTDARQMCVMDQGTEKHLIPSYNSLNRQTLSCCLMAADRSSPIAVATFNSSE